MTVFHDDLDMREFFLDEREDQLVPLPRISRRVLTMNATDMTRSIRLSLYFLFLGRERAGLLFRKRCALYPIL